MEEMLPTLFEKMLNGGTNALLAGVLLAIYYLNKERLKLAERYESQQTKFMEVISEYHRGTITVSETLRQVERTLNEMRNSRV